MPKSAPKQSRCRPRTHRAKKLLRSMFPDASFHHRIMPRLMVAAGTAFRMATQPKKQLKWGGARKGAGRPKTGVTKTRLCISVDKEIHQRALDKWIAASHRGKTSQLVEQLLDSYGSGQG